MHATYDGNTLAGSLSEVFTTEVTGGTARCGSCGRASVVAELAVYGPGPGWVARCPGCAEVMLRLVRTPGSTWLDLSGTSLLRMPVPVTD